MPDLVEYSVVVPVFNSGRQLVELVERLEAVFRDSVGASFEIILVDDGSSREETQGWLDILAGKANVTVITLSRNFGKPGAVICGLAHSHGTWVITIDDDLQQRPEDIPLLIELRDHDVVSASHAKKLHTVSQRVTSRIKQQFDGWILQQRAALSPLKLIRRHVVDGISDLVLTAFAALGYFLAASSLALIIFVTSRKLLGFPISPGWTSIMVAILGVGGLNLAAIGITGQYFIRILDVASKKPAYSIREIRPKRPPARPG